ncbi:MAG: hypothetical protein ACT4NL_13420 [Pseudomarimonas sp.]
MSANVKALVVALALFAASAMFADIALFMFAFTAGPSVAAGERAAVYAGIADIVIAVIAVAAYWSISRGLTVTSRIVATGLFVVLECLLLCMLFVLTLVILNR